MNDQRRLTQASSERCARLFRSLRARMDLSLGDCAMAMGLSPASADAALSRMEHGIGTWDFRRFNTFVAFAATHLNVFPRQLAPALLGDGSLDIDDVVAWNYTRLGADDNSKLLCRLECRWKPRSRWTIFFRQLPGFLLPDSAREELDWDFLGNRRRDVVGELEDVFEAMQNRFMLWDACDRPRLVLVPMPGAWATLIRRQEMYRKWDAALLAEALEFLSVDCIASHVRFCQSTVRSCARVAANVDWMLVTDDLAIKYRRGARVLDELPHPAASAPHGQNSRQFLKELSAPASLRDQTLPTQRLLESVLSELQA
jgi:hypothetical protein